MAGCEAEAVIALGGNLPHEGAGPARTLVAAVAALAAAGLVVRAVSRFYATPCFPPGAGPDYVNAALRVRTGRDAAALLALLHGTEARFGRRRAARWGGRTLDLDLICMGGLVLPDRAAQTAWRRLPPERRGQLAPERLILPHPRLQERAFVLVPVRDVAPGWRHPLLGRTVAEMCAALPPEEIAGVRPL